MPGAHERQTESTLAPMSVPYFPAAQSVQLAWPVAVLYLPAMHNEQSVDAALPVSGLAAPTGHAVQAVFTVVDAYWPAAHALHVVPRPVTDEYMPTAQSAQSLTMTDPVPTRNVPATHATQAVVPVLGW